MFTFYDKYSKKFLYPNIMAYSQAAEQTFAISVDPDETACYEPSRQDLHCLSFCFIFWLISPSEVIDVPKSKDSKVHSENSGMKGLRVIV